MWKQWHVILQDMLYVSAVLKRDIFSCVLAYFLPLHALWVKLPLNVAVLCQICLLEHSPPIFLSFALQALQSVKPTLKVNYHQPYFRAECKCTVKCSLTACMGGVFFDIFAGHCAGRIGHKKRFCAFVSRCGMEIVSSQLILASKSSYTTCATS